MPKASIQRRLIAAVVVSQLLLAVGLVFVALYFTRRQLREAFDAELRGRAMTIAALVRYSEEEHPRLIFEDDLVPPPLEKQHTDLYQVLGSDGHLIARSPDWPAGLQPCRRKPHARRIRVRGRSLPCGCLNRCRCSIASRTYRPVTCLT